MRIKALVILLMIGMLAGGCAQSLYMQGRGHLSKGAYDPAIEAFYKEIAVNPQNHEAWRELGVAFYEKGDFIKSEEALKQANSIQPDARAHLYLGLIYEKQSDLDRALDAYTASLGLESRGSTASTVRSHIDRLVQKRIEVEVAAAITNENSIDVDTIPEQTIAVVNFDASSLSEDMAPIALGLAEFTSIDLAKVNSLTVVERLKLDRILKELNLGRTAYVDPSTAPRLGKLLGSRHVVTGSVLSVGDEGLRVDGAVVSISDSSSRGTNAIEDRLDRFFAIQKDFVFQIISDLGITLSAAERDAINEVPTESYLAFLAYCRGLEYERSDMPGAAQREYTEAINLDRSFEEAGEYLRGLDDASGLLDYEGAFMQFEGDITEQITRAVTQSGLDERLNSLLNNVGIVTLPTDRPTPLWPPFFEETAVIYIRGDLDAQ